MKIGKVVMEWQAAKQKRIAITTSMIDYIKNIKMMGMTTTIMARIQESRMFDIGKGNRFRELLLYFNASGKKPMDLYTPEQPCVLIRLQVFPCSFWHLRRLWRFILSILIAEATTLSTHRRLSRPSPL